MNDKMICFLIHLSKNMWNDSLTRTNVNGRYSTKLITEIDVWNEVIDSLVENGFNSILIDVGDAVKYKSHPEIAVEGAWTPEFMNQEVKRLKKLGLKVYPKLNFSACHDAWLGEYSRMLSTSIYYQVVKDLIKEVCEIFDQPELFHLGLDEENAEQQEEFDYVTYRQFDLIWKDLNFYFDTVRENGARPWMWADWSWSHYDEFVENVPKDVLLSPWYYRNMFLDNGMPEPIPYWKTILESYPKLDNAGYDIVSTGSNWAIDYNIEHHFRFCNEKISAEHCKGVLIAPWASTTTQGKAMLISAAELTGEAKKKHWGNR